MGRSIALVLAGLAGGVLSGLLGVGAGIVLVTALVLAAGISQHHAHATSLAAIVPMAALGALRFGLDGEIDYFLAALLAVGAIVGAPLGARTMAGCAQSSLKIGFGILMAVAAIALLL